MTTFQHATANGFKLFYREAGSKASPTIVLLHGFPSSSHMFRDLIPQLLSTSLLKQREQRFLDPECKTLKSTGGTA
jgi:pimeloyl-ACP methyl ester carboxylesterase